MRQSRVQLTKFRPQRKNTVPARSPLSSEHDPGASSSHEHGSDLGVLPAAGGSGRDKRWQEGWPGGHRDEKNRTLTHLFTGKNSIGTSKTPRLASGGSGGRRGGAGPGTGVLRSSCCSGSAPPPLRSQPQSDHRLPGTRPAAGGWGWGAVHRFPRKGWAEGTLLPAALRLRDNRPA